MEISGFTVSYEHNVNFMVSVCRGSHKQWGRLAKLAHNEHAVSLTGSSTFGEVFNPARDCSDIVDYLPKAKDGFYWINLKSQAKQKVCLHDLEKYQTKDPTKSNFCFSR